MVWKGLTLMTNGYLKTANALKAKAMQHHSTILDGYWESYDPQSKPYQVVITDEAYPTKPNPSKAETLAHHDAILQRYWDNCKTQVSE